MLPSQFVESQARMAELVDAPDLGSGSERSRGSSPLPRTKNNRHSRTDVGLPIEAPFVANHGVNQAADGSPAGTPLPLRGARGAAYSCCGSPDLARGTDARRPRKAYNLTTRSGTHLYAPVKGGKTVNVPAIDATTGAFVPWAAPFRLAWIPCTSRCRPERGAAPSTAAMVPAVCGGAINSISFCLAGGRSNMDPHRDRLPRGLERRGTRPATGTS